MSDALAQRRMCPNEACDHHGQPTGLLGGCDCGTGLVPYRDLTEPTNEQLARLAWLFSGRSIIVEHAKTMLDANPELRAAWLVRHREFQDATKGAR